MTVTPINNKEEFTTAIGNAETAQLTGKKRVSIFDFWADWCPPCKVISTPYKDWSGEERFKDINFYKCDVDNAEDVAQEVGIKAMPTFILFADGMIVGKVIGAVPQNILELLEQGAAIAKESVASEEQPKERVPSEEKS